MAEQLRGFLLEEFEYAIESYQDDMENLLDCKCVVSFTMRMCVNIKPAAFSLS